MVFCRSQDRLAFIRALHLTDDNQTTYSSQIVVDEFMVGTDLVFFPEVRALMDAPNAGGETAQYSEYLSGHLYYGAMGARNFVEEMAVRYWVDYKKVDYLCDIYGHRIGVSVKRAVNRSIMLAIKALRGNSTAEIDDSDFTMEGAKKMLDSAIRGLVVARNCVNDNHCFDRSILHVWCPTMLIAERLRQAYSDLDLDDEGLDVKGVLILHLTVCHQKAVYVGR